MKLEKDLMHQISQRLDHYKHFKQVEWWTRLQCGKIRHFGHWIKLCDKGTPDFLALIRNRQGYITALFIEAKSDSGYLQKDQSNFFDRYSTEDMRCLIVRDINYLDMWMQQNAIDMTKEMQTWNPSNQIEK